MQECARCRAQLLPPPPPLPRASIISGGNKVDADGDDEALFIGQIAATSCVYPLFRSLPLSSARVPLPLPLDNQPHTGAGALSGISRSRGFHHLSGISSIQALPILLLPLPPPRQALSQTHTHTHTEHCGREAAGACVEKTAHCRCGRSSRRASAD